MFKVVIKGKEYKRILAIDPKWNTITYVTDKKTGKVDAVNYGDSDVQIYALIGKKWELVTKKIS